MLIKAAKRTVVVLFSDIIERQSLQLHHTFLNSEKGSNKHFWVLQQLQQKFLAVSGFTLH